MLTLAAGVAVGYVLGTRAGREKYEEIAATARKMSEHPKVVQAQEKARDLLASGTQQTPAAHRVNGSPTTTGVTTQPLT